MTKVRRVRCSEIGQATTELLLCSWVILLFMAAAIQLFKVDRAIFRSLTAAHATHFEEALRHNCAEQIPDCTYDGGATQTRVEWDPSTMPSVVIPIIGLFRSTLGPEVLIRNDEPGRFTPACRTWQQCKRTKMAAGTYEPLCDSLKEALKARDDPEATSGTCKAVEYAIDRFFSLPF